MNCHRMHALGALFLLVANAHADKSASVVHGSWDLYSSSSLLQTGYSDEQACVNGALGRATATTTYNCRTRTDVTVAVNGTAAAPAPAPAGGPYTTTFDTAEYPLSQGGRWTKTANPWTYVRSANGVAYGTNGVTNGYDDSYAYAPGFGANYAIEAVVQRNASCSSTCEAELLLRFSDDSNNARGYEVDFGDGGTVQVIRWNGPFGSYTVLNEFGCFSTWTPSATLKTGDRLKAQINGTTIKAWINDVQKACATDGALATGAPGIGFFIRPGVQNNALSLTSVTITPN